MRCLLCVDFHLVHDPPRRSRGARGSSDAAAEYLWYQSRQRRSRSFLRSATSAAAPSPPAAAPSAEARRSEEALVANGVRRSFGVLRRVTRPTFEPETRRREWRVPTTRARRASRVCSSRQTKLCFRRDANDDSSRIGRFRRLRRRKRTPSPPPRRARAPRRTSPADASRASRFPPSRSRRGSPRSDTPARRPRRRRRDIPDDSSEAKAPESRRLLLPRNRGKSRSRGARVVGSARLRRRPRAAGREDTSTGRPRTGGGSGRVARARRSRADKMTRKAENAHATALIWKKLASTASSTCLSADGSDREAPRECSPRFRRYLRLRCLSLAARAPLARWAAPRRPRAPSARASRASRRSPLARPFREAPPSSRRPRVPLAP